MEITDEQFIEAYNKHNGVMKTIHKYLSNKYFKLNLSTVYRRSHRLKNKGLLPLESGVTVESGTILKGISRYHKLEDGGVWVKSDVEKTQQLESFKEAVESITQDILPLPKVTLLTKTLTDDTETVYISNDVHFGALMWAPESGTDWDVEIASKVLREAYNYLFSTSPSSKVGIIADLGDLLEVDSFSNTTPKSGNPLTVDGRYPKILRAAYESLIYAITRALEKHEIVKFINIAGNHDMVTGHQIREIIRMTFKDNPRVVIDEQPTPIKYYQFGRNLLMFVHGDGLRMSAAGETMAADAGPIYPSSWFVESPYRFAHFGHTHHDSVIDGKILRAESHRNLAGLNDWAYHKGFRRQLGTMKSITYHYDRGEIARNTFNLILPLK